MNKNKKTMANITNKQKLEAVKDWLKANDIKFKENHKTKAGLKIDLWIPKLYIAIHIDDDSSEDFFKKTFKWCKPFFIRENETNEFVLEKIQNCCYDQMLYLQKRFEMNNKKK